MNASRLLSLLLVSGCLSQFAVLASAHGIPVSISVGADNKLQSAGLVAYDPDDSEIADGGTGIKGAIGYYPDPATFPAGKSLTVTFSGSPAHSQVMLYWDGSNLLPSPVSVLFTRTGFSTTINPSDTEVAGPTLPPFGGNPGNHGAINFTLPAGSPFGLYVFGSMVSSPDYVGTETVWAVGNYGLTDTDAVARGLAAINQAVTPEPSSFALAACGLVGLAYWSRRRR